MAKVSVLILVYNHEKYIKQCIESVLNQKTICEMEIILGNDCSTDASLQIIEKLISDFPNKIILISSTKNSGMVQNFISLIKASSGDFICIMDGDDYFNDDFKIQKALDCFQNELWLDAVCHNVLLIDEKNNPIKFNNKFAKNYLELSDTKNGRLIHTNAWLIRKSAIYSTEKYFDLLGCNDLLLELKLLENKKVKYINEPLTVWRMHDKAMSSYMSLFEKFNNFELLYKTLYKENKFRKHYAICLENFYKQWAIEIIRKESKKVFSIVLKSFYWQLRNGHFDFRYLLRLSKFMVLKPANKNPHNLYR